MALDNYRDMSTGSAAMDAGFQFEFYCTHCSNKWQSPFKPYRMGQVTGFLSRFSFLLGGMNNAVRASSGVSDYSSRGAREEALAEAQAQAQLRYTQCSACDNAVCHNCFDTSKNMCVPCAQSKNSASQSAVAGGHACPNCSTPGNGGRFCAECGFDMASTHKSCPGCGALAERQSRFCVDCGHSF